ncbi:threonine-phosphate decarboxylase CobD [Aureimonas pseudogalii]|uniref:threonine-phosphate decarboxylase n=1 Tax=Aureimonas pseudogalii TaxID=1744844 RepID=A0A7W6H6T2_9HYPH|nr:threonine-phosphate decarboxylase CobD [Aureimonas pseudogalii]MBB3999650.1 cobalamin biosynthetic protein CobC [Aureimonas pseudogalii]
MNAARRHGGALDAAIARYGGVRADWLDLSTGINPVAPPLPALDPETWTRLPEAALEGAASKAARRFYAAPGEAGLVAAPGSQALISLLPHLLPPGPAAVLAPTYAEHERALRAAGHEVRTVSTLADLTPDIRLAVLANPNNPDGRRFLRAELLTLADRLAAAGGHLVVDEAFMDADTRETLAADAGRPGLAVLRSFGKFFGLAGLRLGFALTTPDLAARLDERLGPWAVSGPALAIAARWMADDALVEGLREGIASRAALTRTAIRAGGLKPTGDAALFALVEAPLAGALFEALAHRHILTRPFSLRTDWLRLGSVRNEGEAARLTRALCEGMAEARRTQGERVR